MIADAKPLVANQTGVGLNPFQLPPRMSVNPSDVTQFFLRPCFKD